MSVILNLNLSFGDNFFNGELSTSWDSFWYTILGVVIAFGLTLFRDFLLKRKRLKSVKNYFIKTLDSALENVEQAIAGYKESVTAQKSDLYKYQSIKTLHFKHLNYLSNLHTPDLLDILINKSYDDLNEVFINVEHVKFINEGIYATNLDTQKQYNDFVSKIEQNYTNITWNLKARESVLINKSDTKNDEYKYIVQKLGDLEKTNALDFELIKSKLPELMNDDLFKFLDEDLSDKIMNNVGCVNYNIDKIVANNKDVIEKLRVYCISLEDDLLIIKSSKTVKKLTDSFKSWV
ncbi:hypothetical protein QUH73_03135 [Labilibaculum sp. K2S]|uniref:hypothetical protein n=1 Tax=Labilibaculum sp. K2S TaxID=3056386 RepID=UPI0025A3AF24|nr:hypothetical protein [Labilibaculum sp. K2S]MDM8158806.1 hypothetical protein [Labilibaculum sp. K2S]